MIQDVEVGYSMLFANLSRPQARSLTLNPRSPFHKNFPLRRFELTDETPDPRPGEPPPTPRTRLKRLPDLDPGALPAILDAAVLASDFRYPGDWKKPAYVTISIADPLAKSARDLGLGAPRGSRWVFTIPQGHRAAIDFADVLLDNHHPCRIKTKI